MTQYKDHDKFKDAQKSASRILNNPEKVKDLISKVLNKLGAMDKNKLKTGDFLNRVKTFVRMLKAYIKGEYRTIQWKTIITLVAGLVYFVMPLDVIPDFIPVTGFLDDITLILWIFNSFKSEIEAFEAWELENR